LAFETDGNLTRLRAVRRDMKFPLPCPLVVVLALAGCSEAGFVLASADGVADLAVFLDSDAELGRIAVRRYGDAWLGLDGARLAPRTESSAYGTVGKNWGWAAPLTGAVELDGEVLMVAQSQTVRLLLTPDPADLHDVLRFQAGGATSSDADYGDEGEGITFTAGTQVDVRATDDDYDTVLLAPQSGLIDGEAWVPAQAVGKIYDPRDTDWDEVRFGNHLAVRARTEVLDAPGGRVLAVIDPDGQNTTDWLGACVFDAARQVDETNGWARVELSYSGVVVDGWVEQDDVNQANWGCGRCGMGRGGFGLASHHNLFAGTELLDAPDGRPVGTVLMDHRRFLGEPDDEGRVPVQIDTMWGEATVWIDGLL
jgi:hypothetical protein